MAKAFGTSPAMDAYWVAVTPTLVTVNLFEASAIGAAMTFYATLGSAPAAEKRSAIAGFLFLWMAVCALLAVGEWLSAGQVTGLLAPGLSVEARAAAVRLVRFASVSLAFAPISVLCTGLLQARRQFFRAAVLGLVPPAVLAAGQLAAVSDVLHLASFFVAGYVAAAVAAVAMIWRAEVLGGVRPTFGHLPAFLRQFAPLVAGAALIQGIVVRERALASRLEPGAISALSYALRINTVAGGLVAAGFDSTVGAVVASGYVQGDHDGVRRQIRQSLVLVAALAAVLGVLLVVSAERLVVLLLSRGKFGAQSAVLTAGAVVGYFGVYVWGSVGRVLLSAAISQRWALKSLLVSAVAFGSYLLWAPHLAGRYGVPGLALAATLSFICATLLLATDPLRHQGARTQ
jgi:putative peptidoglycan lipid II flippase